MGAELSIVIGLAVTSMMFAYFSYSFKNHPENIMKQVSIFFFFISLFFLNMIMYACILIAQNNTLTYLETPVLEQGLTIITYITTGAVILYFIILVVMTVISLGGSGLRYIKGRGKNDEP